MRNQKRNLTLTNATRLVFALLLSLLVAVSITILATDKVAGQTAADQSDLSAPIFTTIDVPGATGTLAIDINAEGVIVGRYSMAGQTHGFKLTPTGEISTIDFPGANFTVAASINNDGEIVGQYALPNAPAQRHGFLLQDGVYTSFDPPGSTFTNALGINERGDIVGRYCVLSRCRAPGNGDFRGFLLRDGEFTNLDVPGAIETDAFKISASGRILGGLVTATHEEQLFVQRKQSLTTLALPNEKPITLDNAGLNERGDVVGTYCDGAAPCLIARTGTHGFLLSDDEFYQIDVPGASATSALGINARGDIVGGYFDANGRAHAYVMNHSQN